MKIYKNNKVSVVITSCGRKKYLRKTIESFLKCNIYPIFEYLIIEDSNDKETINYIKSLDIFSKIIFNKVNKGYCYSLNKIYRYIKGEYVFHLEDDWLFIKKGGFIEQCLDALKRFEDINQIWVEKYIPNPNSHYSVIKEARKICKNNTIQIFDNKKNWKLHGFTFRPDLMRTKEAIKILSIDSPDSVVEIDTGKNFYRLGFVAASLNDGYCVHIGEETTLQKK